MTFNDELKEIRLDGFQVVSGDYFRRSFHITAPTSTIWPSSLCFNKAALTSLHNCDRVRIEVNTLKRCILIIPVTEKDKDGVHWLTNSKNPTVRKMECSQFTKQLYELWGWDKDLAYRATGRTVSSDKKVMLLFDFNTPDTWKYKRESVGALK